VCPRGNGRGSRRPHRLGSKTGDEHHVTIDDPIQDLASQVRAWGGPVAIEVSGLDPQDLAAAIQPALQQVSVQSNGQTVIE
jgi:hypothetical protein